MSGLPLSAAEVSTIVRAAANGLLRELAPLIERAEVGRLGDDAYPQLERAIHHSLDALATTGLWGPDNRVPSSELWNIAGPVLERSLLINRARTKPRGYAGDYEMLAWIHENRRCDDPLGRLLDRYFQEQAAPQAVRNRMSEISDMIVETARSSTQPVKIGVVGSAFGLDVRDGLRRLSHLDRDRVRLTLLDLDPAAIEYAKQVLQPWLLAPQLTAESGNLFRLATNNRLLNHLNAMDLIVCPGMFDYFDDAQAAVMLACLSKCLTYGGRLVVYQFTWANPTRAYMEWLGNWYLTYRDAGQLRQVATNAGIERGSRIDDEPRSCILALNVWGCR